MVEELNKTNSMIRVFMDRLGAMEAPSKEVGERESNVISGRGEGENARGGTHLLWAERGRHPYSSTTSRRTTVLECQLLLWSQRLGFTVEVRNFTRPVKLVLFILVVYQ